MCLIAQNSGQSTSTSLSASASGYTVPPKEVMGNRTYFTAVLSAYVLGLLVAFGANAVTHSGQPALLYLCPLTLGAVVLTAERRSEFGRVWGFEDVSRSPQDMLKEAEERAEGRRKQRKDGAGGSGTGEEPE